MRKSKSAFMAGVMMTAIAGGTLAASGAAASTYVACNRYDECWKVHEKYTRYPADEKIVVRDSAWYDAHQHDAQLKWLADPTDDAGYYARDGAWHPFSDAPAPHP